MFYCLIRLDYQHISPPENFLFHHSRVDLMGKKKGNRNDSSDDDSDYNPVDEFGNPMPTVSTEGWESCKTLETKSRGPKNANTKKNSRDRNVMMKSKHKGGKKPSQSDDEDDDEKQTGGFERYDTLPYFSPISPYNLPYGST